MLISNFPTFSYITWQGLIIVGNDNEKTPYVVNNANTNCKYVYWETSNPYNLKATNDKLTTNLERFLIYLLQYILIFYVQAVLEGKHFSKNFNPVFGFDI